MDTVTPSIAEKICGRIYSTPDLFVDQLEDLLEHAEKEAGGKPVAIVGQSTGSVHRCK